MKVGSSSGKAAGHETGSKAEQTDGSEPPLQYIFFLIQTFNGDK